MKVFGVGLGRTGTKSLARALKQLGICTRHYPDDSVTAMEVIAGKPYSILSWCDGLLDLHATTRYRELDRDHPGARFIHTVRDKESWLESQQVHFAYYKSHPEPQPLAAMSKTLHLKAYGTDSFDEHRLSDAYDAHSEAVMEHFDGDNLLLMNITAGDGWDLLCPFLGLPIPDRPFPRTR